MLPSNALDTFLYGRGCQSSRKSRQDDEARIHPSRLSAKLRMISIETSFALISLALLSSLLTTLRLRLAAAFLTLSAVDLLRFVWRAPVSEDSEARRQDSLLASDNFD